MGAVGSALATFIAGVLAQPLLFWPLALRILDLSWGRFIRETLVPGLFPAVVAASVGLLCANLTADHSPLVRVLIGIPTCTLAYGLAILPALRPADWSDIGEIRRAITSRFA
jgi:hypothetical protein